MVRVLTWNVWGRNGPWELRQAALADGIGVLQPDIVCLQESWIDGDGASLAAQLAEPLAEPLGYHALDAARHSSDAESPSSGNAILSRWPIATSETRWLPRVAGGLPYRTVLRAEIEAPGGSIGVFCTHFDWQYDGSAARVAQARALAQFVAERRGDPTVGHPPIVAGDLNAVPDADEIRVLTGRTAGPVAGLVFQDAWEVAGDGGPGITWSAANPYCADAAWPRRRIDYVLVGWPRPRPLGNPVLCQVVGVEPIGGVQPSDHYGVLVDLV